MQIIVSCLLSNRPPDKSAYWKFIFLISHSKHMLWVLKKTRLNESPFEHPKHMFKLMGKEINEILGAKTILIWTPALILWYSSHTLTLCILMDFLINIQGTKIFQYCTCLARRVTYNFHLLSKHMHLCFKSIYIYIYIIGFLINVQVQGHHPHQWAPFQVTG